MRFWNARKILRSFTHPLTARQLSYALKLELNALSPNAPTGFAYVPKVMPLSSVQMSGGWYKGRDICPWT